MSSTENNSENGIDHSKITLIEAPDGTFPGLDLKELWRYREMLMLMVWRDVKVRYIQSTLGIGWAIFPALSQVLIYTLVFGRLVRIDSDGAPYSLFALAGVIPWVYFSQALNTVSSSVYGAGSFIQKIYFPRILLPVIAMLERGFDFLISLGVMLIVLVLAGANFSWNTIYLPVLILLIMITVLGFGIFVAAFMVHFRDVLHMMGYVTIMLMYSSPVVYPASLVPPEYLYIYALNPMVGVIEGFRAALLSTKPMPWDLIAIGYCVAILGLFIGVYYFKKVENKFADVI